MYFFHTGKEKLYRITNETLHRKKGNRTSKGIRSHTTSHWKFRAKVQWESAPDPYKSTFNSYLEKTIKYSDK